MNLRSATELALEAVGYLSGNTDQLSRFLEISALAPQDLTERLDEAPVLAAVLSFLLSEDKRLLDFCGQQNCDPREVHTAVYLLENEGC